MDELLRIAQQAAEAVRPVSLAGFRSALVVDNKALDPHADVDPVTEIDRECERLIRDHLQRAAPDIAFVGEESQSEASCGQISGGHEMVGTSGDISRRLEWVVDPIDGTRAFVAGVPLWSTLIALCDGGKPILGVADFPAIGECYLGMAGKSIMKRADSETRLRARDKVAMQDALMCCTTPDMFTDARQQQAFAAVRRKLAMTRFGTDAYGYALLAAGRVDVVIESDLAPWDLAAVTALVRGAGGVVSDWRGNDALGGSVLAAANPRLHAALLDELRPFL